MIGFNFIIIAPLNVHPRPCRCVKVLPIAVEKFSRVFLFLNCSNYIKDGRCQTKNKLLYVSGYKFYYLKKSFCHNDFSY